MRNAGGVLTNLASLVIITITNMPTMYPYLQKTTSILQIAKIAVLEL